MKTDPERYALAADGWDVTIDVDSMERGVAGQHSRQAHGGQRV
jgi:hypothetical protein